MTTPFPFVSGAVLTAAQLNAITEVPVSAKTASYTLAATDAGSRITMNSASATTITVNTGLFTAGQSLRIQNLNGGGTCTVTAGTATVTSAGSLIIPSWGGGQLYFTSASAAVYFPDAVTVSASGLTLITAQTIGSAVSSVAVTGCFSATYNSYKIMMNGGVGSASTNIDMILTGSTSGYINKFIYGTGANNTVSGIGNNAGTRWQYIASASANSTSMNMDIYNPFLATQTQFSCFVADTVYDATSSYGMNGGAHSASTSYTGFTLTPQTGTLTGGTIRVYGYANS